MKWTLADLVSSLQSRCSPSPDRPYTGVIKAKLESLDQLEAPRGLGREPSCEVPQSVAKAWPRTACRQLAWGSGLGLGNH